MVSFVFLVLTFSSVLIYALLFDWLGLRSRRFGWIAHLALVPVALVTALVLSVLSTPVPSSGDEGNIGDGMVGVVSILCWAVVATMVIPAYYIRLWLRWSKRRTRLRHLPAVHGTGGPFEKVRA